MRRAYIIVFQEDIYNTLYNHIFGDLRTNKDVYYVYEKTFPENGLYRFLPSRRIKKITAGLSDRLYFFYYDLPTLIVKLKKEYDHISVLMHNASLIKPRYPLGLMKYLKKMATFNLLYMDVHDHVNVCGYANYLAENDIFDRIFTIDPNDAKKYKMRLISTPYSSNNNLSLAENKYQLYYCGSNAGRMYPLYRIWEEGRKRGLSIKYDLTHAEIFNDFFEEDDNIIFNDFVPYDDVIKRVQVSSCILDITQKDQAALTVRPYEAVVYSKKLLTNNKNILNFKYYDSRFMQYFERVEDIDWNWISQEVCVNYNYQGDFSPQHLLDKLI